MLRKAPTYLQMLCKCDRPAKLPFAHGDIAVKEPTSFPLSRRQYLLFSRQYIETGGVRHRMNTEIAKQLTAHVPLRTACNA